MPGRTRSNANIICLIGGYADPVRGRALMNDRQERPLLRAEQIHDVSTARGLCKSVAGFPFPVTNVRVGASRNQKLDDIDVRFPDCL